MRVTRLPLLLPVLALCSFGCNSPVSKHMKVQSPNISPMLQGARVDAEASEIIWEPVSLPAEISAKKMNGFRKDIAKGINEIFGPEVGMDKPTRYRLRVKRTSYVTVTSFIPCAIFLTLFACPAGVQTAEVELEMDINGRRFTAEAKESVVVNQWYNMTHVFLGAPVAEAATTALLDIDKQVKAAGSGGMR